MLTPIFITLIFLSGLLCRLLTSVTTPWSGKSSPETFLTLSAASRCLQVLTNEATPESSVGRVGLFMSKLKPSVQHSDDGVNTWRAYQSSLLPTFIINLESRRDRYDLTFYLCTHLGDFVIFTLFIFILLDGII